MISRLWYLSWLDSVHRQAFHNGQRCTTSWNIWKATRASRLRIGEVTENRTCCLGTQIRIGAIALLDDQRQACSCCTTNRQSHGSPRCRRLQLSRLPRLSTTPHQQRLRRFLIRLHIHGRLPSHYRLHTARPIVMHTASVAHHTQ